MALSLALATSLASGTALLANTLIPLPPPPPGSIEAMELRNILWAADQFLALVVPSVILFAGVGARLRRLCAWLARGNWFWTVGLFAVIYLFGTTALVMPFDYFRDYALGNLAGRPFQHWVSAEAVALGVKSTVATLFVWIPYALMIRSPQRWWLYSAAAVVPVAFLTFVILPIWVDPITTEYRPLVDKALYAQIESLAARCGVQNIPVVVGGDDTSVVGLGPTNRIVLEENLQKRESPDQIRFTIGHELKHYVEGDNYKALAIVAVLSFAGLWLVDLLGRVVIARYSGRLGFADLSDPASLPLAILILLLFWLLVLPFFNLFARHIELEADRFGLELTHENRAMAEMEAAYVTRDHQSLDWDTFSLMFRATHPSNGDRIRFANTYRPWAEGKSLVYADVCTLL